MENHHETMVWELSTWETFLNMTTSLNEEIVYPEKPSSKLTWQAGNSTFLIGKRSSTGPFSSQPCSLKPEDNRCEIHLISGRKTFNYYFQQKQQPQPGHKNHPTPPTNKKTSGSNFEELILPNWNTFVAYNLPPTKKKIHSGKRR